MYFNYFESSRSLNASPYTKQLVLVSHRMDVSMEWQYEKFSRLKQDNRK